MRLPERSLNIQDLLVASLHAANVEGGGSARSWQAAAGRSLRCCPSSRRSPKVRTRSKLSSGSTTPMPSTTPSAGRQLIKGAVTLCRARVAQPLRRVLRDQDQLEHTHRETIEAADIVSEEGGHQGCPLGPALFCLGPRLVHLLVRHARGDAVIPEGTATDYVYIYISLSLWRVR